jgi:hypothetical protein
MTPNAELLQWLSFLFSSQDLGGNILKKNWLIMQGDILMKKNKGAVMGDTCYVVL